MRGRWKRLARTSRSSDRVMRSSAEDMGPSPSTCVFVRIERVVPKPANLTFEQAAAVPVAAITALQGLRDKGQVQPGQRVLINGASGGVGTFAVQIAKALGAEVAGVGSTRNVDLVRSIGADHVIDYTLEDFTLRDQHYDLMLDVAGSRSWSECRRVLNPQATLVIVGGPKSNRLIGPLGHVVRVRLAGVRSSQKIVFFIAKLNKADMAVLRELLEAGKVTPVIDRRYELSEIADALRYMGEGHARGKVVITCEERATAGMEPLLVGREHVANAQSAGIDHERAHGEAGVSLASDRSQNVEIALDATGLRPRRHHATLDPHIDVKVTWPRAIFDPTSESSPSPSSSTFARNRLGSHRPTVDVDTSDTRAPGLS